MKATVFLFIFGFIFFAFACVFAYFSYKGIQEKTVPATGTVREFREGSSGNRGRGRTYAPVVVFYSKDGNQHIYNSNFYSSPPEYVVGEKVTIYYNPEKPDEARLDSFSETWLFPLIFGAAGLVIMAIGVVAYLNRTKTAQAPWKRKGVFLLRPPETL